MSQTPPERPALEHRATSQAVDHHNKYGRSNNLHFHEEFGEREPPKRLSELFSKPVIRQVRD
jgi:hypothetical protein